jgi:hypothetical protein
MLERGEQGGAQAIPPTLQQSLAARLDRLGEGARGRARGLTNPSRGMNKAARPREGTGGLKNGEDRANEKTAFQRAGLLR